MAGKYIDKVHNPLGKIPPPFINWWKVILIAIILIMLLVICFVPYPHSQGESIFQHIIWM